MWSTVFKPRSLRLAAVHRSHSAALSAHNRYLSEAAASQRAQRSPQEGAGSLEKTNHTTAASSTASTAPRAPRAEGTIASVFASLSGEEEKPLPERFASLKRLVLRLMAMRLMLTCFLNLQTPSELLGGRAKVDCLVERLAGRSTTCDGRDY